MNELERAIDNLKLLVSVCTKIGPHFRDLDVYIIEAAENVVSASAAVRYIDPRNPPGACL